MMKIEYIKTENDFEIYVKEIEEKHLEHNEEYELYNTAFKQLYGTYPFDEIGNCIIAQNKE